MSSLPAAHRIRRSDVLSARRISEHAIRETSTDNAPWLVVAGGDHRYRELAVGEALVGAIEQATVPQKPAETTVLPSQPSVDDKTILDVLDLSRSLDKKDYETRLEELQGRVNRLTRRKRFQKDHAVVVVFEGTDAAGKGGAIRRIAAALDARSYHVVPIAALMSFTAVAAVSAGCGPVDPPRTADADVSMDAAVRDAISSTDTMEDPNCYGPDTGYGTPPWGGAATPTAVTRRRTGSHARTRTRMAAATADASLGPIEHAREPRAGRNRR